MKRLPDLLTPAILRWLGRIAIAAAVLSTIGYFSPQNAIPLMCKIYG